MLKGLKLDPDFLEREKIIAKLQLVIQLEKNSPYAKGTVFKPLPERMLGALRVIPEKYQQYVLALFSNTIYCTEQFSTSIMLHLFTKIKKRFKIKPEDFGKECFIIEVDPTGMINDFLRLNKIQGRLDKNVFQREQQLGSFVNRVYLLDGLSDFLEKRSKEDAIKVNNILIKSNFSDNENRQQLDKKYWVILTDNALSGTSICSDLRRLLDLAKEKNKKPTIIILIRALTYKANEEILKNFKEEIDTKKLYIEYGIFLNEEHVVNDETENSCKLFNQKETHKMVREVSEWFVQNTGYKDDKLLIDHKKNSGDDMRYGFKKCGLTFVSAENCPSNSLPLLWYKNEDYVAPFPRVLSRIGGDNNVSKC